MIKQAYISCPLTVPSEDLENVIKRVKSFNLNKVHYYGRGTAYNTEVYDSVIDNSDAFILVLPGLAWAIDYSKLTTGCRREFDRAMQNPNKQLFIAYKMASGIMNIYSATIEYLPQPATTTALPIVSCIKGLSSTSGNFAQEVTKGNEHTKATAPTTKPKTSWPDMIQEQAEAYKKEADAIRQAEKLKKFAEAYGAKGHSSLYEQLHGEPKKLEYAMPKDPKKWTDLMEQRITEHYEAQVKTWEQQLLQYEQHGLAGNKTRGLDEAKLDYAKMLKNGRIPKSTPINEQPLAAIAIPKETVKGAGRDYTIERDADGTWRWEFQIKLDYDPRLLLFF